MNYQTWVVDIKTRKCRKIGTPEISQKEAMDSAMTAISDGDEGPLGVDDVTVVLPTHDLSQPGSDVQQTLGDEVVDLVVTLDGLDSPENGV